MKDDQDLRDARIAIEQLEWFTTRESKAQWLALILRGKRNEIEHRANMKAARNLIGEEK